MSNKIKLMVLINIIIMSILMVGCSINTQVTVDKHVQMEDVENYLVTIGILGYNNEENVIKKLDYIKDDKKDVENIVLELDLTNYVLELDRYETILKQATYLIKTIEEKNLGNDIKLGDYTIKFRGKITDIYGNDKNVKLADINIKREEVEKINFEKFNYLNLDKIADITEYKEMKDKKLKMNESQDN